MTCIDRFVQRVSTWPGVSVDSHRFGGKEFRFGSAEIGHIHNGGILDIPFPRQIHDALLEEHLAEKHHWVPDSGWTTFRLSTDRDLDHALTLMRLSYLRYVLKTVENPDQVFELETLQLGLSSRIESLLKRFVPRSDSAVSA